MVFFRMLYTHPAWLGVLLGLLSSCAVLHRVQLSDINRFHGGKSKHISVKVSETTISFQEAGAIARTVGNLSRSRGLNNLGKGMEYYTAFFQMGPKTGTPVFNEQYARNIPEQLLKQCPNGTLTDITSVRESRAYPVVKGEIIRIDAICVTGHTS